MIMDDMAQAVDYFRMHYNKQINIEKYAASKNISVSWFIQNFKQYTNTTPAQYIQNLRLSNAKSLLETTNYNVTEISNLVGYENPLYFSAFSGNSLALRRHSFGNNCGKMKRIR